MSNPAYNSLRIDELQEQIKMLRAELSAHIQQYNTVNQRASVCFNTLGEALTALGEDVDEIKSQITPISNS